MALFSCHFVNDNDNSWWCYKINRPPGFSITQWELFSGIFPPINEIEWNKYFNLYKEIPQYKLINLKYIYLRVQNNFFIGNTFIGY